MKITKDTLINEVLEMDSAAAECFFMEGMFCIGCPAAAGEAIGQACIAHGVDPDRLVQRLNDFFGTTD